MAKTKKKKMGPPPEGAPSPEEIAKLHELAEKGLAEQEAEEEARAADETNRAAEETKPAEGETKPTEGETPAPVPETSNGESQAVLVVCQCRSTGWTVKKATATAVSLVCSKCGLAASVKGSVAEARISSGALAAAVADHLTRPKPKTEPAPPSGSDRDDDGSDGSSEPTLGDQGFRTLRFRIDGEQDELIQRAMEAVRIMNHRDEQFRVQQWQGSALEYICADFLSGVDPAVIEIVEAIEAAESEEAQKFRESSGEDLPAKRARAVRQRTRDALADELFPDKAPKLQVAPHETEDLAEAKATRAAEEAVEVEEEEADERILDEGALLKSVRAAVRDYAEASGEQFRYLLGEAQHFADMMKRWDESGGFMFAILGDARTKTSSRVQPRCWLWIQFEFDGATLAVDAEYADEMFERLPDAQVEVVELLPAGYSTLPADDQWEIPGIATRREEMR
jgi:hypothetical protein